MTDATQRIKNLSIALKALTSSDYRLLGDRVFILLSQAISEAEKETQWPRQRPATTTTDDYLNPFTKA